MAMRVGELTAKVAEVAAIEKRLADLEAVVRSLQSTPKAPETGWALPLPVALTIERLAGRDVTLRQYLDNEARLLMSQKPTPTDGEVIQYLSNGSKRLE